MFKKINTIIIISFLAALYPVAAVEIKYACNIQGISVCTSGTGDITATKNACEGASGSLVPAGSCVSDKLMGTCSVSGLGKVFTRHYYYPYWTQNAAETHCKSGKGVYLQIYGK